MNDTKKQSKVGDGRRRTEAGTAVVTSFVERTHHAVLARCQADGLFDAYLAHASDLGPVPEEVPREMMRQALAIATLQLALLPPDQFCSWTLNVVEPELNLFLAGDNNGFQLTGRVHTDHVHTVDVNRLFVESQRPKHKAAKGVVDFDGTDVIDAFRQYYLRSLQMRAGIYELSPGDFVMIQGLPMVDRPWLAGLDVESVGELMASDLEKIEDRTYRFHCGCSTEKMQHAVREMFSPDELFGDKAEVEVQCPRCGRLWAITRGAQE